MVQFFFCAVKLSREITQSILYHTNDVFLCLWPQRRNYNPILNYESISHPYVLWLINQLGVWRLNFVLDTFIKTTSKTCHATFQMFGRINVTHESTASVRKITALYNVDVTKYAMHAT